MGRFYAASWPPIATLTGQEPVSIPLLTPSFPSSWDGTPFRNYRGDVNGGGDAVGT